MRLLEFEAKSILSKHKIPVPKNVLLNSPNSLNIDYPVFLKAQIPLGGRGKAGGVVSAPNQDEARKQIAEMLSKYVRGYKPNFILAEEMAAVEQEFFMAVTYDTVAKLPSTLR